MIKEQMEVLGSDGVPVGKVDHMEGRDQVKLMKDDPDAGGEHHFIPLAWVDHVDSEVHLKQSRRRGQGALEDPLTTKTAKAKVDGLPVCRRPVGRIAAGGVCLCVRGR
jgi:hypothetical protein